MGVFTTYFLLALKGKADGYNNSIKDGQITYKELTEYVRDKVVSATQNLNYPTLTVQTPTKRCENSRCEDTDNSFLTLE